MVRLHVGGTHHDDMGMFDTIDVNTIVFPSAQECKTTLFLRKLQSP